MNKEMRFTVYSLNKEFIPVPRGLCYEPWGHSSAAKLAGIGILVTVMQELLVCIPEGCIVLSLS